MSSTNSCGFSRHETPEPVANLPRIEIESFSGAPEDCFMNTFKCNVESRVKDSRLNLSYLTFYCNGIAKEAIRHYALLPEEICYRKALHILKQQFGRDHVIVQALTKDVFEGAPIRHELEPLQTLARLMATCLITLGQLGKSADLNCSANLLRVVRRLPRALQHRWAEKAEEPLSMDE